MRELFYHLLVSGLFSLQCYTNGLIEAQLHIVDVFAVHERHHQEDSFSKRMVVD